ncbi:MAG: hypothetical protein ICV77_04510 [Cyanobacteria bacterium Co-bin8]|nr:hypothetical protein [Cyanobacteria bacterium Co-bin8]
MSLAFLWLRPASAQPCAYGGAIAPTPTTRTYQHQELGFTFEIPANYRAMGLANSRVAFYDPATFEYVQCAVRNRQVSRATPAATLYVNYAPLQENNLLALTQRVRPWLVFYQPAYEAVTLGNIPVLPYRYVHQIYGNSVLALSFRSLDQQWLVTLEGAPENPITPLALATIQP